MEGYRLNPKPEITHSQILSDINAEIAKLPTTEGVAGITAPEFARARGVGREKAREQLDALKKAGVLEQVKVRRQRYDDTWTTQNGFRPK